MVIAGYEEISRALSHPAPATFESPGYMKAAVAMVLSQGGNGLRILFIERATHPGDPWSGNIGFPGGKVEPSDAGAKEAAERETMEELSVDLSCAKYLGRLSDLDGSHLSVQLSCFVYLIEPDIGFIMSDEVKDVFWVDLDMLTDSSRHGMHQFTFAGDRFESPCVKLPYDDKPVLWGLTYRMVGDFLTRCRNILR